MKLNVWDVWGDVVEFDAATGDTSRSSGEADGFVMNIDGVNIALWSDGSQLVFQVGAKQWPLTSSVRCVLNDSFTLKRDDEVLFTVANPNESYDVTSSSRGMDVTEFFQWLAKLINDENAQRGAIEKWRV